MKWFRLQPDSAASGAASAPHRAPPGTGFAIAYGAVSFGIVSAIAYSIWAYRLIPENSLLYATTAAVYLGLGGLALSRLVVAPGAWKRFPLLFALAFLIYAIGWCAGWFGLRGKNHGDLWGALAGLAGMTWLFRRAFGSGAGFLGLFLGLFVLHSIGYYAGGELYSSVRGTTGRLLWGAAHGLGFGAGLGYVLARCQALPKSASNRAARA